MICVHSMHYFELEKIILSYLAASDLAWFQCGHATALKPTHEAGRRGGDSIARRHVFNYQN